MDEVRNIGIVGYGEVGKVFAGGLIQNNFDVHVYDLLTEQGHEEVLKDIKNKGATPALSISDLVNKSEVILLLVNSAATKDVIASITKTKQKPLTIIDLTTSKPYTKKNCKIEIENYHPEAIYIDGAIMGTVATEGFNVPLLLASENEEIMLTIKKELTMNIKILVGEVGKAASIKLIRSVFMKGLEALLLESMIAAKKYNVDQNVMESISMTLNNNDFNKFGEALIKTHVIHKNRRYKEILDSIKLIEDAKIEPYVTQGVKHFFEYSVERDVKPSQSIDEILTAYGERFGIKN